MTLERRQHIAGWSVMGGERTAAGGAPKAAVGSPAARGGDQA